MAGWLLAAVGLVVALPLDAALVELWPSLTRDGQAGPLAAGAAGGVLAGVVLAWRVPFLLVLDHEIAHLLAALVCLRKPRGLSVGEDRGQAVYDAGRGSVVILLAPYAWPWLAWLGCVLHEVVRTELREAAVIGIGAALGFSAVRIALDLRPHQSDLRRVGLLRAGLSVLAWGPLGFAVPALWALGGWEELQTWAAQAIALAGGLLGA